MNPQNNSKGHTLTSAESGLSALVIAVSISLLVGFVPTLSANFIGENHDEFLVTERATYYQQYAAHFFKDDEKKPFGEWLDEIGFKGHRGIFFYGAAWPILHTAATGILRNYFELDALMSEPVPLILLYSIGIGVYYLLAREILGSRYAIVATILLLSFPRLLTHAVTNTKDTPVMIFVIIACYYVKYLKVRHYRYLALCAAFSAIAAATKFDGLLILAAFAINAFFFFKIQTNWRDAFFQLFKTASVFSLPFVITYYITWPPLWASPLHIAHAFSFVTGNLHGHKDLYWGTIIGQPKHYGIILS
jgi:hypothetical protein